MIQEFKAVLLSGHARVNHDLPVVLEQEFQHHKGYRLNLKVYTTLPSVEDIIRYSPQLIFVYVPADQREEGIAVLDHMSRIGERIPVVVCSSELDADLMLGCVKRGVRDFLKHPFLELEVREMLDRMMRETVSASSQAPVGSTYTLFSYKGGLGTTFVACNTAVALARVTKAKVLLWDLVIQSGDVPFFFDYEPQVTLSDLLESSAKIDDVFLKSSLPTHPSGVSILAVPKRPEEGEGIRNDHLQALHQTLRRHFDYIVIDGGHVLTDQIISAMDVSKYVLLTTDLHLPVLKNTLRCLEVFERLGYTQEKFKLILNRYNSKYQKFDLDKAQEILRYPVSFTISNDYLTVSKSLNTGIPIADLDETCALAKQFDELAQLILHDFKVPAKQRGSFLKALFGGRGKTEKTIMEKKAEPPKPVAGTPAKTKGKPHAA